MEEASKVEITAGIVAAYVANNSVPSHSVATMVRDIYAALSKLSANGKALGLPLPPPVPAVPIQKSITPDFIICLEDGKKFKSLRRHLSARYNMTPSEYRAKWDLGQDYPMVAPNYAAKRSSLAKETGLGKSVRRPR